MIAFKYIYGELILFLGFILYFIYNIYSIREIIVKVQSFLGILKFKNNVKTTSFIDSYNFFFFLKNFLLNNRVVYLLKYIISEKNSLFYISFLCLLTLFLYVYQLFWFLQVDILENNRIFLFSSVYVVDGLSLFLKILITFLAFFFFFYVIM
jgi:hypothetical protein